MAGCWLPLDRRRSRLCRYVTRPPFAQDRLAVTKDGSIVYRFRKPWRNGKSAVVMAPMTFLSRLAAQVPPPRSHVLSYFGVLAAAASRRDEIVPGHCEEEGDDDVAPSGCGSSSRVHADTGTPTDTDTDTPVDAASTLAGTRKAKRRHPERMLWAELVQRVFLTEILRCPCGGRRRVLAMIFNPASIERVLRHLGLPHEPMPRAPPRPMQGGLPFAG
jgi:hypothetical protein